MTKDVLSDEFLRGLETACLMFPAGIDAMNVEQWFRDHEGTINETMHAFRIIAPRLKELIEARKLATTTEWYEKLNEKTGSYSIKAGGMIMRQDKLIANVPDGGGSQYNTKFITTAANLSAEIGRNLE